MNAAWGFLETTGLTPAMAGLDAMEKTAGVRIYQLELNDLYGVCIKIAGTTAAVDTALAAGFEAARRMEGKPVMHAIHQPGPGALRGLHSPVEYNPLIQQNIVQFPQGKDSPSPSEGRDPCIMDEPVFALGFIETQGFTAVFEAIDSACKAANVDVVGKEKLGGGFITVVIRGDVAAVKEAVEAGRVKVEGLGKLIAAHVIPRPSPGVLALLPKL